MRQVKLIRYADEGFRGYLHGSMNDRGVHFVTKTPSGWKNQLRGVYGCFVFVEEIDHDALVFGTRDRSKDKVNIRYVPESYELWAYNVDPVIVDSEIDWSKRNPIIQDKRQPWLLHGAWLRLSAGVLSNRAIRVKEQIGYVPYDFCEAILEC